MDDTPTPERRPGGTVEPSQQARAAQIRSIAPTAQRFELHDPFAEVTYRTNSLGEISARADKLGATRFFAIAADGTRSAVNKTNGRWQQDAKGPSDPQVKVAQGLDSVGPLVHGSRSPERPGGPTAAEADRSSHKKDIEASLHERYVIRRASVKVGEVTIGRTQYHFRGDTTRLAFTESTFKLSTESNNPTVARSMVDVAEARQWKAIRVTGNEDFKRLVWLEASVRGVKAIGYDPHPADLELLRKEREARKHNKIERVAIDARATAPGENNKQSARGSGGRKAVLAALEAILVANKVPPKQREAVMTAAQEHLARRVDGGQFHKVKVFDKAAASQRPVPPPTPEAQRLRDRADRVR